MSNLGASSKPHKAETKMHFSNPAQLVAVMNAMTSMITRYAEIKENSYYLPLALSKDIYNSMKAANVPPMPAPHLNLSVVDNKRDENSRPECKSTDSTCCSGKSGNHYRLSEGVTFAEITNKLNCYVGENFH